MKYLVVCAMLALTGCAVVDMASDVKKSVVAQLTPAQVQLSKVNAWREKHKLPSLSLNNRLARAAQNQADYMAKNDSVTHTQGWWPFRSTVADRAEAAGYKWSLIAENVAGGQEDFDAALQGWKDSPGHNENMLNPKVKEIGMAYASNRKGKYRHYWVMVLGRQ